MMDETEMPCTRMIVREKELTSFLAPMIPCVNCGCNFWHVLSLSRTTGAPPVTPQTRKCNHTSAFCFWWWEFFSFIFLCPRPSDHFLFLLFLVARHYDHFLSSLWWLLCLGAWHVRPDAHHLFWVWLGVQVPGLLVFSPLSSVRLGYWGSLASVQIHTTKRCRLLVNW